MADTNAGTEPQLPPYISTSATGAAAEESQRPTSSGSGNGSSHAQRPQSITDEERARMEKILLSETGVTTLLTRLKQSISSIKDFAAFLRKRSLNEESHASNLKKLAQSLNEIANKPDNRQQSLAGCNKKVATIHEQMAGNSNHFALTLHEMSEELNNLATNLERGRKSLKTSGLSAEKHVRDAEAAAEKAAVKYRSLADQYEKARSGEGPKGKFGIKKSGAQLEEDLLKKVQIADSDYISKVRTAQAARTDLVNVKRPDTVRALQDLILEGDSGLSMQMQKFVSFTERLILSNGLVVSPVKSEAQSDPKTLREAVYAVNSEADFKNFILERPLVPTPVGAKYEQHPAFATQKPKQPSPIQTRPASPPPAASGAASAAPTPVLSHPSERLPLDQNELTSPVIGQPLSQHSTAAYPNPQEVIPTQAPALPMPQFSTQTSYDHDDYNKVAVKHIIGISLEDLYRRDQIAVPFIVFKCTQAVDVYGLDSEGIYRQPGSMQVIEQMARGFERDPDNFDLLNPETFAHDINNVAGLLKHFFRALPVPLLTDERHDSFIAAAQVEDENQRRDAIHTLINDLPDANYATLRVLILHLNRVQEHSARNQMTIQNIALSLGYTLLGDNSQIANPAWVARVVETMVANALVIFEDDADE